MSPLLDLALFVGGEWLGAAGRRAEAVINPATGHELGLLPHATQADLAAALDHAARGFAVWRKVSAYDRSKVLRRAAELLREREDELATLLTVEQGKALSEARLEWRAAIDVIEWYAEEGRRAYGRLIPSRTPGHRQIVVKEPVGPVAAFAPWNFPALTPARKIAASLAAGCSCIIKPSEETPFTTLELARAFDEAGLPKGVLNVVFGNPAEVSETLLASTTIKKMTFTGSTPVGKHLGRLAAEGVKRATLELGGHAPVLVFADADVDAAVKTLVPAKYRNAGQICVSPTRFFVEEPVFDRFVDQFVEGAALLKVGNGLDAATQMGPLANPRRIDAMTSLISDAVERGAELRTGGERIGNAGFFFQPTVLVNVPSDARIMSEEPFGPVAIINRSRDFDDACEQANSLPFGLAAYAFTQSARTSIAVGDALESGMVGINTMAISVAETPFGGVKESGHGSESGMEGLEAFLNVKFISQV